MIQKVFKKWFVLSFIIVLGLSFACNKETSHQSIPDVAVNVQIDPNSTMYLELNTIGGWVYLTGGYRGILVYRLSNEDFVAYDRACPYEPYETAAIITMDASGITCSDLHCGSQFNIVDGSVIKGPSTMPLKQFYTYYDGNILLITN